MFWFHPLQNISITASRRLSGNHSKSTVNSSPNWGWHYWINISHLWMYTKHGRIISYCTIVSSVYFMSIWLNHSIASYISIDFKYSTIADNSKFFMIQYDTSWFSMFRKPNHRHIVPYQILWDLRGFISPCSNQMQWWRWRFACYIHSWIKQYRQHVAYCWAQHQQHRLHRQSRPAGRCCQKHEHHLCSVEKSGICKFLSNPWYITLIVSLIVKLWNLPKTLM